MRKIYVIFVVVALGIAATFSGCKKEVETSDLVLDDFKTAKINLVVGAIFDQSVATPKLEAVPSGTKVIISAPYSSFGGGSGNLTQEVALSGGKATVDVKVPSAGATYTVTVVGFNHDFKDASATTANFWEGTASVTVTPNTNKLVQITCTGTPINF